MLVEPPDSTVLARVAVQPGQVTVFVGSGSGTDYHERAFEGTGVTAFDAAKGASVDSTLTETTATAGTTKGDVGAITRIKGSVECGDQTPGTSTVTFSGETAEGPLAAAVLDPVRVECDASPQGDELAASGIVPVGSTQALISLGLTSDGSVTVDLSVPGGSHRYLAAGTSSVTSTGAHVEADVVEADVVEQAAVPARTLHVEGDLTCGLHADG